MKRSGLMKVVTILAALVFLVQGAAVSVERLGLPGRDIPVLVFHELGDAGEPDRFLPAQKFAWMMDYLGAKKFHVLSIEDYVAIRQGREKAPSRPVVLTFDDGEESLYRVAYPVLKRHGFPAAAFIVPGFVGKTLYHVLEDRSYSELEPEAQGKRVWKFKMLSWDQAREMERAGFSFQSHSRNHAELVRLTRSELVHQFVDSKRKIEDELEGNVRYLAYPWGEFNREIEATLLACGYKAGFATHSHVGKRRELGDLSAIPRYEITPFTRRRDFKIIVWGMMPWKEKVVSFVKALGLYEPARGVCRWGGLCHAGA